MSTNNDTKEPKVTLVQEVANLFEGADVTPELQDKIGTVLETVVAAKVREFEATLQEQFDSKLEEAVASARQETDETVNKYLDYVVGEWMQENALAVDTGIRTEMTESFIDGIRTVFESHNVEIPEGKVDAYSLAEGKVSDLEERLDESITTIADLKKSNESFKRLQVLESVGAGLADTQKEKLAELTEGVAFVDSETFTKKATTIRESFFTKDDKKDGKKDLTEDFNPKTGGDDVMSKYMNALRA